jgi:NAD(P)H-hydrate epimerase
VITPHPGELHRLAPDAGEAEEPSWNLARRLAQGWGVTLVIKGAFTGIGAGDSAWVHARPNPGLATGGTGDVLTGIVAALLARGLSPAGAARLGVWTHGEAGWQVTRGRPAGGSVASDLLPAIPAALAAAG